MSNIAGGCKTGAEHLESLRDGRAVFVDGRRVADVTVHPAFRNALASASRHSFGTYHWAAADALVEDLAAGRDPERAAGGAQGSAQASR
jgi:4-hydroxyphenylacetate 3-monooxygenase